MKIPMSDPCFPNDSDFPSLYRVVTDARPVGISDENCNALYDEAVLAMVAEGCWTGPNGVTYEALFHSSFDDMIVGYRKLREKDWFTERDGEVAGPFRTKRLCIRNAGAKRSEIVRAGHYIANGTNIFTRDMAEQVIGRAVCTPWCPVHGCAASTAFRRRGCRCGDCRAWKATTDRLRRASLETSRRCTACGERHDRGTGQCSACALKRSMRDTERYNEKQLDKLIAEREAQ